MNLIKTVSRSASLYERIENLVPGGVHSNSRFKDPHPIYFKEAQGAYITDVDGNRYLDVIMGNGASILGHNHQEFNERMRERLESGIITGLETELSIETAEKFLSFVTTADQVKFTNTGTEAVMHTLHIARAYTGKQDIAVIEGAYNGWYDAVNVSTWPNLELAGDASKPNSLPGALGLKKEVVQSTVVIPFNDLEATERLFVEHHERLAALIIEPTMIDVGYIPGTKEYLQGLRDLCTKFNIILVFDELLTGFRESKGGLQVKLGITPDLSTFGKAISNGYPMAAVCGKAEVMEKSKPGPESYAFVGTYNGHQVSLAASLSFMELYEELNVLEILDARTEQLITRFNQSAKEKNVSVKMCGKGGHFHWYFSDKVPNNYREAAASNKEAYLKFIQALSSQGVFCSSNYLLHHAISLAHEDEELEKLLKYMDQALLTLV